MEPLLMVFLIVPSYQYVQPINKRERSDVQTYLQTHTHTPDQHQQILFSSHSMEIKHPGIKFYICKKN